MGMAAGAISNFVVVMVMDIGWMIVHRDGESRNRDQRCWNPNKPRHQAAHGLPDQPETQTGNEQET